MDVVALDLALQRLSETVPPPESARGAAVLRWVDGRGNRLGAGRGANHGQTRLGAGEGVALSRDCRGRWCDMSAEWELLRGLFEGALERPTHERAAFLDEHTKDDPLLRREIESLARGSRERRAFPERARRSVRRSIDPMTPCSSLRASGQTRLAAGTSLGAFTILEPLGAGGMGEVYRARDTRLDRQVAIKVLSSERDTAPGSPRAVRARGACDLPPVASAHLHGARHRRRRRSPDRRCRISSWSCSMARRSRRESRAGRSRSSSRSRTRSISPTR